MSNSDNPKIGAVFQKQVLEWFSKEFSMPFLMEEKIPIGSDLIDPSEYKLHKFDIVSDDRTIIIECKCYTWTETLNVPSAKMGFVNEAALYLSLVKKCRRKYIVIRRSYNHKRKETLAEYYYRTNRHLLGDVVVAEYDMENKDMRFLNEDEIENRWRKRVYSFALKYLALYKNSNSTEKDVLLTFADECFSLGIRMDCEKRFIQKYGLEPTQDATAFKGILQTINDIDELSAEIFSKWRYITHWAYADSCLDEKNREWFVAAFCRLVEITAV